MEVLLLGWSFCQDPEGKWFAGHTLELVGGWALWNAQVGERIKDEFERVEMVAGRGRTYPWWKVVSFWEECGATSKKLVEATKEREKLITDYKEAGEIAERIKLERDGPLESYSKVMSSICQIFKAREKRKATTVDTLSNFLLLYKEGGMVAVAARVAKNVELRRKVTELGEVLDEEKLLLQPLPG